MVGDDVRLLTRLGKKLDERLGRGITLRDALIERLLRVRSKTRGLVFLRPNRAQREYSQRCSRRNIVLKARQLGITTYVAARYFIATITQPGTTTVQVAHSQESAEEIFRIVHRYWENLPEALQRGALTRSHANVRQIVFPRIDSEYRVATAADANAGRGMTIHNLHCSEVARWPRDGGETLASLRAAVPADGNIALESTPNGSGGVFYDEWQNAGETGYTRHFFPWWFEDSYATEANVEPLTAEENELVERHGLTAAQIAFRRINRAQMRGLAAQEYAEDPVSCFRASGECVFDLESIDQALRDGGCPIEAHDNGRLNIWFPPQAGKRYVIGVDAAGGGSEGDYACAEVVERHSGMQCAELRGHFSPMELARRAAELGLKYNEALIAVERNNHGFAVLAHMEGYPNLYCEGEQAGWLTSVGTRPAMIEGLAMMLVEEPLLFRSPTLLSECRSFVRRPDGNSAASSGAHDDTVMAMAIALEVRKRSAGNWQRMALASLPKRA